MLGALLAFALVVVTWGTLVVLVHRNTNWRQFRNALTADWEEVTR